MTRTRDILGSLPLLAAVLGRNYGVEVRIGGREAKTNGRVIYLPSLPLDCESDVLGFARGFTDHEAAHIRHSDFKALQEARQEDGEAASPTASIAALFTTKEEDLPRTRGEYAAQHLATMKTGPEYTALTVATAGTAKTATIPPAEREEALRASITLRSRLQGLLQAHTLRDE